MSDETERLSGNVKSIASGLGTITYAEQILEAIREKYETAIAHGWHGVAGNMQQAGEHLEAAIGQLQTAATSTEETGSALAQIHDQMSSPEVVQHLDGAIATLGEAQVSTDGALELIEECNTSCQAAGLESLPEALTSLADVIGELREQMGTVSGQIEAERHTARTYPQEDSVEPAPAAESLADKPGPVAAPKPA
jgi:hypothetical protein